MVVFLKHIRHFLLERTFLLGNDHSSLRWLSNFKQPEGQLTRWLEILDQFDYDIVQRPERLHSNADGVSRRHTHTQSVTTAVSQEATVNLRAIVYKP